MPHPCQQVVLTVLAAAAEQVGHHLLWLCALRVGCIGPATQPPASGVDRSCDRPCLGHLRWALCSRWRPSTPSFALLLLQSVVPSRLVSFGTLWLPFLCFSRVQGPGGCFRRGGACQRACSPRRRYPDEVCLCAFVPCSSPRLVSSVIVFSGNWRCMPALPQLAVSEPAGVPSWGGTVRCGACAESL